MLKLRRGINTGDDRLLAGPDHCVFGVRGVVGRNRISFVVEVSQNNEVEERLYVEARERS